MKVAYILSYIPLPFVIGAVWVENSSIYNYYTKTYTDSSGEAFVLCIFTLVIYIVSLRLIKLIILYITLSQKPDWKKEFKKLF